MKLPSLQMQYTPAAIMQACLKSTISDRLSSMGTPAADLQCVVRVLGTVHKDEQNCRPGNSLDTGVSAPDAKD